MNPNILLEKTVNELKDLSAPSLEEVYDFVKYLKYKSGRKVDWKIGFREALDKMSEISSKQGITERDF